MPHLANSRESQGQTSRPVIILAGGRSARFGMDKLDPSTGLLTELLDALIPTWQPIIVGPARDLPITRDLLHTREDPPGGGPGAGLIAGLQYVRSLQGQGALSPQSPVAVLPGDGPRGWRALDALGAALGAGALAVWTRSPSAGTVPLPAMLSADGVTTLLDTGATGVGESLRALLGRLNPTAVDIADDVLFDVDTKADLADYRQSRDHPHA